MYNVYIYIYIHTFNAMQWYIYIYIYLYCFISFPTCQVKVIRLYVSWPAAFLLLLPPPDHNCKLQIAIFPAGPEQQGVDQSDRRTSTASSRPSARTATYQSVPRRASAASSGSKCSLRTSTASTRSECCPPDINHKESPKIYQIDCQKECQKICQIHMPERMS